MLCDNCLHPDHPLDGHDRGGAERCLSRHITPLGVVLSAVVRTTLRLSFRASSSPYGDTLVRESVSRNIHPVPSVGANAMTDVRGPTRRRRCSSSSTHYFQRHDGCQTLPNEAYIPVPSSSTHATENVHNKQLGSAHARYSYISGEERSRVSNKQALIPSSIHCRRCHKSQSLGLAQRDCSQSIGPGTACASSNRREGAVCDRHRYGCLTRVSGCTVQPLRAATHGCPNYPVDSYRKSYEI
ncbi:hypothetical protein C8Q80DRAFT_229107 [Daedaleopsis nitida]|nr:hypothetical protein C8Q80DRAFT_229107 [Daedaleopsis nitida]